MEKPNDAELFCPSIVFLLYLFIFSSEVELANFLIEIDLSFLRPFKVCVPENVFKNGIYIAQKTKIENKMRKPI